ncbi:adenylate/guanylate cyclase domain-containing protein [archaeon]|nr:MAG: adenylate/guanylate cyclase domain-containing protein [archaeon]
MCYPQLEEEGEGELVDWVLQSSKPEYMRMVSSFIPLPVTLAFESGGLRYLAEIREVTTMFMKWDCYDPYTHRNLVSLQSAFFSVQSILDEAGGFLRQFLVDDKGCVLIACWGVPTASFTNNAHRALSAATKIHHHFLSINMSCSIGITTGNVYCGNVGSEMRREYAAIGDVVNLSARLMSKAKGGIYVDEATYSRLSVRMWEMFEELEPMMVKGKPQPIQAYAYHTSHAVPEVHNEGSGEGQEIQTTCKSFLKRALESLIRPALRKRSAKEEGEKERPALHTVVIEGRSGSGKFSTVQWLRRQAENRELRVIHIGGLEPNDSLLEYKVTAKLFSLLIGADVYNNPHSQHMVVIHLLHEIYGNNNDMIDKVALPAMRVAFNLSDQQLTMGNSLDNCNSSQNNSSNLILKRKVPARMIADTVREIFAYFLAEQAHVVIVENLHCCDDSSLKCLAALRDVRASSLVVYTLLSADEIKSLDTHVVSKQLNEHMPISRQGMHAKKVTAAAIPAVNHVVEGIEVFRNLLLQQPSVHYMVLDNYNVTEIEAMVSGALGMEQVPLGLAQWVQQLSGGSIYWIKEILQFLKSLGPEEFASVASFQSFGALARQSSMHSSVTKMFSFSESPDKGVSSPSALTLSQTSPGNAVSAVDAINAQLELLILCRFENLPQDDQRILKAASIIGCYFSK